MLKRILSGVVEDAMGNGNNGRIHGATQTNGQCGDALLFDGVKDYVDCGNNLHLNDFNAFTADLWVKPLGLPQGNSRILSCGDIGGGAKDYQFTLYYNGDVGVILSNGKRMLMIGAPAVPDTFHHVVAAWDGKNCKLFLDDEIVAEGELSGPLNAASANTGLFMGAQQGKAGFFKGIVDEVRIYRRFVPPQQTNAATNVRTIALRNSSFTQCTNDRIPDWWRTVDSHGPDTIENWEGCFEVDAVVSSPVSGTQAVRLSNPGTNCALAVSGGAYDVPMSPGVYVASLYLKRKNRE